MVVFACNSCGSSLKKNQVDRHFAYQCQKNPFVSCMDCGKDFSLREYGAHIRCVTEDEKYGGLNYVKKPSAEKGLKKQESWLESIHNLVTSKGPELNPKVRQLLEAVAQYPNVPRKQAKFNNFCKTSLHCKDERLLAETWELVSGLQQKPNNNNNSADQAKSNGTTQNGKSDDKVEKTMETDEPAETETTKLSKREKKEQRRQQNDKVEKKDKKKRGAEEEMEVDEAPEKKRKRKMKDQHMEEADGENEEPETGSQADKKKKKNKGDEVEENCVAEEESVEEEVETPVKPKKFKWEAVMTEVLQSAADCEMPVKKLRKRVLAEYESRGGEGKGEKTLEWALSRFEKKLNNAHLFKVQKERVKLVAVASDDVDD